MCGSCRKASDSPAGCVFSLCFLESQNGLGDTWGLCFSFSNLWGLGQAARTSQTQWSVALAPVCLPAARCGLFLTPAAWFLLHSPHPVQPASGPRLPEPTPETFPQKLLSVELPSQALGAASIRSALLVWVLVMAYLGQRAAVYSDFVNKS